MVDTTESTTKETESGKKNFNIHETVGRQFVFD